MGIRLIMKDFSELLEELREERRISKRDLALRAGLTPGYVSLLTRGERTAPSEEVVSALADALELDQETKIVFFQAAGYPTLYTSGNSRPSLQQIGGIAQKNITVKMYLKDAPDTKFFYGRQEELTTLENWVLNDYCRVVSI